MARPKGVIQKRDETKYWLPDGVNLINSKNIQNYNKSTILEFNDDKFGVFESSFKAIQDANASTHPSAVKERRNNTNLNKYGHTNPGANKDVRQKAKNTMLSKYGVANALESKVFLQKSQQTLMKNYGVSTPMESDEIVNKIIKSNIEKYGVDNVMKVPEIRKKLVKSFNEKYGVDNPMQNDKIKEKLFKSLLLDNKVMSSKGENEIKEFINSLGFVCKSKYLGGKNPKQIDIFIENSTFCIEYNGSFWHSEYNKKIYRNYHIDKTIKCEENGLKLMHIFDFEWNNKKDIIKSIIKSNLGKNEVRIYARKCEIKEVDKNEAKVFLETNHLLGSCFFKKAYGLYYNNELVSLVSIGMHHRNNNNKELVLNRFIVKNGTTVVGGLSKLCKYASSDMKQDFITWVDRRMSDGNNWIKVGWEVVDVLKPDYFYYNIKNAKITPKQSRKKSVVNTPKDMTEHKHALLDGLYRIYDCGKIKLRYKYIK